MDASRTNAALLKGFHMDESLVQPLNNRIVNASGEEAYLPRKPMDVLVCLAARAGEVVSKEEIMNEVWGRHSGGEEGLKRCIHAIRKALQDDPQDPHYIKTVHRRGYICESSIQVSPEPSPPTHENGADASSTPIFSTLTGRHSISILHCRIHWSANGSQTDDPQPERIGSLLPDVLQRLQDEVTVYQGSVRSLTANAIQVWFGLDGPQESSARRALYCGLALLSTAGQFNANRPEGDPDLSLTIAVDHGELVATDSTVDGERVMIGQPLEVVESLASLAPSNALVCTTDTLDLTGGEFQHQLIHESWGGGLSAIHRVVGESWDYDFATHHRYSGELIARDIELGQLQRLWESTGQGIGAQAIVCGDSGIGKSRLVSALCDGVENTPNTRLVYCQCSAIFQ